MADAGAGELLLLDAAAPPREPGDDWPPLVRAAHDRRLELLARLPLGDLRGMTCVEYGCGPWGFGTAFPRLRECGEAIGLDPNPDHARAAAELPAAGQSVTYLPAAGEHLRLAAASADLVFCNDAADRAANLDLLFDEFHRMLRPRGHLVLTAANADAYPHRLRGERYAAGPDRLSPLTYAELLGYLGPRFEVAAAFGYNRTFHDAHDPDVADPGFAREWAGLFADRPDLASGVVVHARRRGGYLARGYVQDTVPHGSIRVSYHGRWRPLALFDGANARMTHAGAGASAEFEIQGETLLLFFWAHDWSGTAAVTVDDRPAAEVNLYARPAGFRRLKLADLGRGTHRVAIAGGPSPDPRSRGDQILFYQAVGYQRP